MKKFFSIFVVGLAMVLFPMVAQAKDPELVFEGKNDCVVTESGTCKTTYNVKIVSDIEVDYQIIPVTLNFAPVDGKQNGVIDITFQAADGWQVDKIPTGNGYIVNYTSTNGSKTAKSFDLGTMVVEHYKDTNLYDCSMEAQLNNYKTTIEIEVEENNPHTGASLPYIILSAGLVVAAIVYVVSKKNTKLYKI